MKLQLAADDIIHRQRRAAIRHLHDLHAGGQVEQLASPMQRRAAATRTVIQLPGSALGPPNELFQILRWRAEAERGCQG